MPRNKQKQNLLKRRLIRLGLKLGALGLVVWLGALLWVSGLFGNMGDGLRTKFYALTAARGFRIEQIYVEGRNRTNPDTLRTLLNVKKGDPILAFQPDDARRLLEKVTWIKSVRVERRLPNEIYIGITERVPLALWQHKGALAVIDEDGVVLTRDNLQDFGDLPILTGDGAPEHARELIGFLNAEPVIAERVEAATRIGSRRWDLKLTNGIKVRLPEQDLGFAFRRLAKIQNTENIFDKDIVSIDLRQNDRLIVQTSEAAAEKRRNEKKDKENGRAI